MKMHKGLFISVEGHDGSGKTTQIQALQSYLAETIYTLGLKGGVVTTRDPGGVEVSEEIRKLLLNSDMCSWSELLLFAAARKQLETELILPRIETGHVVISDRWFDSTYAYQAYGRELMSEVEEIMHVVRPMVPDFTFFLSLPLIDSMDRITQRNETADRFDQADLDFKTKVHNGFIEHMSKQGQRVLHIDASQSIENVSQQIKHHVDVEIIPVLKKRMQQ